MVFGASYESAAVVPDGTSPPPVANPVTDYVPVARPGGRAPHVWIERDGQPISTLDLFGPGFTVLAGPAGGAWRDAAHVVAGELKVPLAAYTVGKGGDVADPENGWMRAYGVDAAGAVLVRPDGYVAWRSRSTVADPSAALERVLHAVIGRTG